MGSDQIHLAYAMYATGTHPVGWTRSPARAATDIGYFRRTAKLLEAARFDMILRADNLYTRMTNLEAWSRNPLHMNTLEPVALFAALSDCTESIGMAATVSTTYSEPYNIARLIGTLDHVTHGRAAWNVVTSYSTDASRNFGQTHLPDHDERYGRAQEFVEVVRRLWDTYEDDAFVNDPESGYYFDPAKFHPVDFEGKYLSVHGGLNCARPPQGYPVTVQAGGSPQGQHLAATTADVVFTANNPMKEAQAFYADMHQRLAAAGRDPNSVRILPGLTVMVGETSEEAIAKYRALEAQVPDVVKLQQLSEELGNSLLGQPLDQPIPEELIPDKPRGGLDGYTILSGWIHDGATPRDLMGRYREAVAGVPLCADAATVADFIEERVSEKACDGFTLIVPTAPSALEDFCRSVIPELQRRGAFRQEYAGSTLRDHLGLPRPDNRHVVTA